MVASPNQHEFKGKDYATVQAELSEISLSGGMLPLQDDGESASNTTVLEQLFECAKNGDLCSFQQACARAMRYHVRLDTPGYMGWTAAHWAAREGNVDLLQYLTLCHANLYALDFKGDTLLHKAAANGQPASCEWLLERGFSVNMRNYNNLTPLDLARERIALSGRSSGAALCEKILVKHS